MLLAVAMNGTLGRHTLFMFDNSSSSLPPYQSGALRVLVACAIERSRSLPDVAGMPEVALPGFLSSARFELVGPPGTAGQIGGSSIRLWSEPRGCAEEM